MDPTTLLIASTAMQAVGAIQQGNAAADNYRQQAAAADYNAAVSRNQAEAARIASTSEQTAQNRKARQMAGLQRAAAAQSGLGFTGSNLDVIERSETLAELDQLNLAYEGNLRANGFLAQADLDDFSARVSRKNASSAKQAGLFKSATSVVGGGFQYSRMSSPPKSVVRSPSMSLNGSYSVYG